MAIRVKDPGTLANKWATRAQAAVSDYTAGVQSAQQAGPAAASADTWQQAVTSPTAKALFVSNLNAAGDAAWQQGVLTKGKDRYAPGVAQGKGKWQNGVQPYLQALQSLQLPPRGLRRSAQNMARVQAVVTAMANVKTGGH